MVCIGLIIKVDYGLPLASEASCFCYHLNRETCLVRCVEVYLRCVEVYEIPLCAILARGEHLYVAC